MSFWKFIQNLFYVPPEQRGPFISPIKYRVRETSCGQFIPEQSRDSGKSWRGFLTSWDYEYCVGPEKICYSLKEAEDFINEKTTPDKIHEIK